jgi:hypothetical protein
MTPFASIFFAQFDPLRKRLVITWFEMGDGTREMLMIFAALAAVVLLVFGWALFFRKRQGQAGEVLARFAPVRKRKRRSRREAPRNATFAE